MLFINIINCYFVFFGVLFSISIGGTLITRGIIESIASEPLPFIEKRDPERYATEMAAYKKVARIGWPIYACIIAIIGSAGYIATKFITVGSFVPAGIIFGVIGIVAFACAIGGIISLIRIG